MKSARYLALALFLVATFAAGAIGSSVTIESVRTWYPTIAKPAWNPPDWIFAPVWTTLYVVMATAAWRVWRKAEPAAARRLLVIYGVHLVLNALWSVVFFAFHRPDLALVEILVLWSLLVTLLIRFWRADRLAGVLWSPYVAWVTFATGLNATIWYLNW
jgi:tryptophan-rich sensory protein